MESDNQKTTKSATLKLTDEQKTELAATFGQEIIGRLDHIELDQIAGFLKANMVIN